MGERREGKIDMIYSLKYTDDLPEGFAGWASRWYIKIRPMYRDDEGLLEHEKTHVWQFWRTLGLHVILREFGWYRLRIEVEAYKVQLKYPPANLNVEHYRGQYAGFIATKYDLKVTVEEATKLLS